MSETIYRDDFTSNGSWKFFLTKSEGAVRRGEDIFLKLSKPEEIW